MAKKESEATVAVAKEIEVKIVQRPHRKVSFEQWASARGVKEHHKGGMKAHVPNHKVSRSYEAWDKVFSDY